MSDFPPQKEAGSPPYSEKEPPPAEISKAEGGEGETKKKREYKDFGHDEHEATRMQSLSLSFSIVRC